MLIRDLNLLTPFLPY